MQEQSPLEFNIDQRQSSTGMFIEFFFLVRKFLRAISVIIIYLLLKLEWQHYIFIVLGIVLLFILLGFIAYLSYRNTLYRIDDNSQEFILQKGVINKEKLTIQLDKIVQVNINQNFWQRLFDVYAVEIETAGSANAEVKIKALDKNVAFALKENLLDEKIKSVEPETLDSEQKVEGSKIESGETIRISLSQIIKYAFTTDYLRSFLVMLGIDFSLYSRLREQLQNFRQSVDEYEDAFLYYLENSSLFLAFIIFFLFSVLVNAIRNIIKYYGLNLSFINNSTNISYGLLSRFNTVLQNKKTQTFTISTQWIQKFLGLNKVRITQVSSDIQADKKAKINIIAISGPQINQLFERIYNEPLPKFTHEIKPNVRLVFPMIIFYLLLPIIIFGAISFWFPIPMYIIIVVTIYLIVASILIGRYAATYRLSYNDRFILLSYKFWKQSKMYIKVEDIQSVKIIQYAWLKKSGIAHMQLETAGGSLHFSYGSRVMLQKFSDWILYKIEKKA